VHAATRYRAAQEPSMLDYIITDEEKLIENMKIGQPLGKSDHVVLEYDVILKMS